MSKQQRIPFSLNAFLPSSVADAIIEGTHAIARCAHDIHEEHKKKDWHECQSLNMLQAHAEKISIVSPSARVTMAFFQVRV